jgi:hypothetical protein
MKIVEVLDGQSSRKMCDSKLMKPFDGERCRKIWNEEVCIYEFLV